MRKCSRPEVTLSAVTAVMAVFQKRAKKNFRISLKKARRSKRQAFRRFLKVFFRHS